MASALTPESGLKRILVFPAERLDAHRPVFEVLRRLYPVRFLPGSHHDVSADGCLFWDAPPAVVDNATRSGLPTLALTTPPILPSIPGGSSGSSEIAFVGPVSEQPFLFRTRFRVPSVDVASSDNGRVNSDVVATIDGKPFWWETVHHGQLHRRASVVPEGLPEGAPLFPRLLEGGWIRWLPILHFLRSITVASDWVPHRRLACFMFDDPNLHWKSWGFIDYRRLVRHADENGYHVAMATVPADMWFTHRPTAELFRTRGDRISLLVHGVLHTHAEFQRRIPSHVRRQHLEWGLSRIEEVEHRHGIHVSRVMAPPHHACSPEAAQLMLEAGLEAACVSWTALMRWNPKTNWSPDFGLWPVEFLGNGFPVIPRFNFADQDRARAVLAHLFHQPIVMLGHHYDIADGPGVLSDWARWVSSFGNVEWTDLESIARSNFLARREGDTLYMRLCTRLARFRVPEGVRHVVADRPWWTPELVESVDMAGPEGRPEICRMNGSQTEPIRVREGDAVEIRCIRPPTPAPLKVGNFSRIWPLARRLACEVRDRLQPVSRLRRAK